MLDIYAMVVPKSDSKYVYTNFIGAGDIYAMVVPNSDSKYIYTNFIGAGDIYAMVVPVVMVNMFTLIVLVLVLVGLISQSFKPFFIQTLATAARIIINKRCSGTLNCVE